MDIFPETYNDPIFLLIVDFVKTSLGWGGWWEWVARGQQQWWGGLGEWVARGEQQWWGDWGSG